VVDGAVAALQAAVDGLLALDLDCLSQDELLDLLRTRLDAADRFATRRALTASRWSPGIRPRRSRMRTGPSPWRTRA
jgi:hypothetical protein